MIVEARLSDYIKDHGIRQSFICERAKINKDTLNRVLSGKQDMDLDDFERVMNVLKKSPNDFILVEQIE